jgi:cytoskeletal protein CcmA (bactofilin family)
MPDHLPQNTNMQNRPTTVIGPDTHIKGEMMFDSTARILGTFEGRIVAKGEVQIGDGAACKASVEGASIVVDGLIEGDVLARERVQLNAKARIIGDVVANTLIVAEGASFMGNVRVGAEAVKAASNRPRPVQQPQNQPAPTVQAKTTELDATLAGLEARLSGISRKTDAAYANGSHDNG